MHSRSNQQAKRTGNARPGLALFYTNISSLSAKSMAFLAEETSQVLLLAETHVPRGCASVRMCKELARVGRTVTHYAATESAAMAGLALELAEGDGFAGEGRGSYAAKGTLGGTLIAATKGWPLGGRAMPVSEVGDDPAWSAESERSTCV